jgi:hypothetical protein
MLPLEQLFCLNGKLAASDFFCCRSPIKFVAREATVFSCATTPWGNEVKKSSLSIVLAQREVCDDDVIQDASSGVKSLSTPSGQQEKEKSEQDFKSKSATTLHPPHRVESANQSWKTTQ